MQELDGAGTARNVHAMFSDQNHHATGVQDQLVPPLNPQHLGLRVEALGVRGQGLGVGG